VVTTKWPITETIKQTQITMDNKQDTNSFKVLKCCAGEGLRRPVGNMCEK
jgi:hypothetical protein